MPSQPTAEWVSPDAPTPETVVRDYAPFVYNLAFRLLGNETDAEDVAQNVFVQVVRKLHTFRGQSLLSTWLYTITLNEVKAYRRRLARRPEVTLTDPLDEFLPDGHHTRPVSGWRPIPDQLTADQEVQTLIEQAILRLPEKYRDVFVLADVEELPHAEIARILGMNVPGVRSRLHRARLMMRHNLAPHFEETSP